MATTPNDRSGAETWRPLQGTRPAWYVLVLALCATAVAWYFTQSASQREARQRFETEIDTVRIDLRERLRAYEQVLRGGVSAFYSWPSVSRENWQAFVGNLHITQNYPGIQGIGFAQVVPPRRKQAHEEAVRAEGFPDYRIWPQGERDIYTAIVYLEPFGWRNQRAFGYDMFQEPVRRAAMERARDTGLPSLTGKVTLVQETDEAVQAGFLMYLPLYTTPSPDDLAARRRSLTGYVYSPFRMDDFMRGLLQERRRNVVLKIYDGPSLSEDGLMYAASPEHAAWTEAPFMATLPLELSGRTWTLRFAALPSLNPDLSQPLTVAAGGLTLSLLLWGIVWTLATRRAQAAAANERLQLDIAMREQIEDRLRETETSFRYLFAKNPNPMWVFDRESLAIIEVNDAAVEQYGYSHDEFRSMSIVDLRPAEDVPRLKSYMQHRRPGLLGAGEWRHLTKDGRIIDVDVSSYTLEFQGRPATLVVSRDITESRRNEEALRESEAVARGVLDSALDAYVRMDQQGFVAEWNLMAERTFGWTRQEAMGRKLADLLIPADQREAHQRGLARYLDTRASTMLNRRIEVEALHRHGRTVPVEVTILALSTGRGELFSAFLRDLTEKKQTERDLRQAQKMEAVGQLTGGVAHDFNNLLTVIIGNLENAGSDGSMAASTSKSIDQALAAADKGAALTQRLLAFSRQQALQPVRTDLNSLIGGMIELLRRTLGEDIDIEARRAPGLWSALADRSQVENALLNLTINARDAMPQGGRLTIETENVQLDEDYASHNSEVEPGDYVMLAVTDTGVGMAAEVVERAFDPFYTTKGPGRGSGLGLSMIYGFAKQSGGHVKIYSEVGHGTAVRLYLPRAEAGQPDKARLSTGSQELRGSETILVVEDEAAVRMLVVRNLRELGYRVLEAADGAEALARLRGSERIDLLFTDVVLPAGVTGRQLAEEAQSLRPAIRVLFTSGYTQNSIVHQGKLDPDVHLLNKPYRREDLARKVREVLEAE